MTRDAEKMPIEVAPYTQFIGAITGATLNVSVTPPALRIVGKST